ncbi:MAG: hypothetical protein U0736_09235 [Gemmataceae bacterium]
MAGRKFMLEQFLGIEIGGGLGDLEGEGVADRSMGYNSRPTVARRCWRRSSRCWTSWPGDGDPRRRRCRQRGVQPIMESDDDAEDGGSPGVDPGGDP